MTLESIAWRGTHVELPPDARTVLVYGPKLSFTGPESDARRVWLGWFDRESGLWLSVDAVALERVTHWAEMPKGAD